MLLPQACTAVTCAVLSYFFCVSMGSSLPDGHHLSPALPRCRSQSPFRRPCGRTRVTCSFRTWTATITCSWIWRRMRRSASRRRKSTLQISSVMRCNAMPRCWVLEAHAYCVMLMPRCWVLEMHACCVMLMPICWMLEMHACVCRLGERCIGL